MKTKARQFHINFLEPESFALSVQTTTDGDRLHAQREQSERDRAASESRQTFFLTPNPNPTYENPT